MKTLRLAAIILRELLAPVVFLLLPSAGGLLTFGMAWEAAGFFWAVALVAGHYAIVAVWFWLNYWIHDQDGIAQ